MTDRVESGPRGLGGWLIVVATLLIILCIRAVMLLGQTVAMFRDGTWASLQAQAPGVAHPLLAPLVIFEIVTNIGLLLGALGVLGLFFMRSRRFPSLSIWLVSFYLFVVMADFVLTAIVLPDGPNAAAAGGAAFTEISRSALIVAAWIPYMRRSKRVRNTFVRSSAAQQGAAADAAQPGRG